MTCCTFIAFCVASSTVSRSLAHVKAYFVFNSDFDSSLVYCTYPHVVYSHNFQIQPFSPTPAQTTLVIPQILKWSQQRSKATRKSKGLSLSATREPIATKLPLAVRHLRRQAERGDEGRARCVSSLKASSD